jgi:hypothetical protein
VTVRNTGGQRSTNFPSGNGISGAAAFVDTPDLNPNAATDFNSASSASGSVNSLTYAGVPTTTDTTIITVSYTNTTGATQTIEFFAHCRFTVSGAGGGWLVAPRFTGTYAQTAVVGRTLATDEQYSYSASATVANGVTATMTLSCEYKTAGTGSTGMTFAYTDATLKYNVLKR